MQNQRIINKEGIVLSVKKAGTGGRLLQVFTRDSGTLRLFVSHASIKRYGTGCLAPYALISFTLRESSDLLVMTQYEGTLLLDMMALSYEEMSNWYFISELVTAVFPPADGDIRAWKVLGRAAVTARVRNKSVCACMAAFQLLVCAGFNPCEEEPQRQLHLSSEASHLLRQFVLYSWGTDAPDHISRKAYEELVQYMNAFIKQYCDLEMKIKFAA